MRVAQVGCCVVGLVWRLLAVGGFVCLYQTDRHPGPQRRLRDPDVVRLLRRRQGPSSASFAIQNRESIPLDEMPQTLKDAVVAAENQTFWTDKGIDPKGILRAAFSNAQGNATQGASTITQQYVKILYLTQERSYSARSRRRSCR